MWSMYGLSIISTLLVLCYRIMQFNSIIQNMVYKLRDWRPNLTETFGPLINYNLGNSNTVRYIVWVGVRYITSGPLEQVPLAGKYRPGKRGLSRRTRKEGIVLALKRPILVFSVLALYDDYSHSRRVCWISTVLKMVFVWSHGNLTYTTICVQWAIFRERLSGVLITFAGSRLVLSGMPRERRQSCRMFNFLNQHILIFTTRLKFDIYIILLFMHLWIFR